VEQKEYCKGEGGDMSTKVLMEITEENLETGLRGVPVGYCTTSNVNPEKGLHYKGQPVSQLAFNEPEEVLHLLVNGHLPSKEELETFKQDLQERAYPHPSVLKHVEKLPKEGHPMALFSCAILILGMYDQTGDWKEDCLNLIAKIPTVTASVINTHAGWKTTNSPKPELGYMENFVHMLGLPEETKAGLTPILKLYNILHFDHGGGNLSAFVGKAVASGLEDMYGSLAAAMNALAGPRHGRANQECLHFIEKLALELGDEYTEKDVESALRSRLEKKELLYGFGHAVLRVEDPRATIMYEEAQKNFSDHPLIRMAQSVRKMGEKVLQENPKISDPHTNVDAISGALLTAAGFPYPEYYTVLFGLARCVGISIQVLYERAEARDGKGTPIVRPKYIYKAD
jgi:citrate synthase